MENFHKRAALFVTLLFLVVPALVVPETALARDPNAGIYDVDIDAVVGGEPGEDPHLRVTPVVPVKDCEPPLGAAPQGGVTDGRSFFWGARERESGPGSRVNRVWRLMFQMWFWTLQR